MLGIFLDTETNGLNPKQHRVIEIAYKILDVGNAALIDSFESIIFHSHEEWKKSDPLSLKINGFSWIETKNGMSLEKAAEEIKASFSRSKIEKGKAVFICQNPSFDRAFFTQLIDTDIQEKLNWPYHWLDLASMYWMDCLSKGTFPPSETALSKNQIAASYHLPPETTPHRAMNGVNHLLLCYRAIVGFPGEKRA